MINVMKKNLYKAFCEFRWIIVCVSLLFILWKVETNNSDRKKQLESIRTTQDSLHAYYKFNHIHHYDKCAFIGADLEGDN